jgi:hypothetical protein
LDPINFDQPLFTWIVSPLTLVETAPRATAPFSSMNSMASIWYQEPKTY